MTKRVIYFTTLLVTGFFMASCVQVTDKPAKESPEEESAAPVALDYRDYGNEPFVFNIEDYTRGNDTYRTALWTGEYMQLTVMSILPGEDIGLEIAEDNDQFIRVEEGTGVVRMGDSEDDLSFEERVEDDFAIMIPAGKWHNVINDEDKPLKLYSIYAPKEHKHSTLHNTREDAMEDEHDH